MTDQQSTKLEALLTEIKDLLIWQFRDDPLPQYAERLAELKALRKAAKVK